MLKIIKFSFFYLLLFISCIIIFEFSAHFFLKDGTEEIDMSEL